MITPERAPVRPRVKRKGDDTAYLLEEEIAELLQDGRRGVVLLRGGPGYGKSTALAHLAAVLPIDRSVGLLDANEWGSDLTDVDAVFLATDKLVVTTLLIPGTCAEIDLELVPWSQDEWIEYLLACHPAQCKSVMFRLLASDDCRAARYPAEICRVVLDEMAADETVVSPLDAMICRLNRRFTAQQKSTLSESALQAFPLAGDLMRARVDEIIPNVDKPTWRLLKQPQVFYWIAAVAARDRIRAGSRECTACLKECGPFVRGFLSNLATMIRGDDQAIANLREVLAGDESDCHPAAATVAHLAGALPPPPRWDGPLVGRKFVPRMGPNLSGAWLEAAKWQGADLSHLKLAGADFTDSDLQSAKLDYAGAAKVVLCNANLIDASLEGATLISASLNGANLTRARGRAAFLMSANCTGANFDEADFNRASFYSAVLAHARFRQARLIGASLERATISQADFTLADLSEAQLNGLTLNEAIFSGAILRKASLRRCVLDEMTLSEAEFTNADLTGSTFTGSSMPGASFHNSRLCNCGLAAIEWPGADLFGADLRGAVFSMGGSRSGLVGSPYPGHGTRTGFYTDDFNDLSTHKHPEEIRKANLCGVDLRGANIEGVDFYLVDLRGARYDPDQAEQLRRCGAILKEPVA